MASMRCGDPVDRVLVTGALGNVGGAAVDALRAAGIGVRCGDRDPARAVDRFGDVDAVHLDLLDDTTFAPSLEGCDALFLLRPPPISKVGPTLNRLIDVAAERGVRHIVFSSVAGAESNRIIPHHRVEQHLMASGVPWTMLRPGFFAQNLGDAYRRDITEDHRLFVPAGSGRVAFIDVRDLGEVAAKVLASPAEHAGRGYLLTGPEAVTFDQVATVLSRELGEVITYEAASVPRYVRHLRRRGMPLAQVAVQTILHTGLRTGDAEDVSPTVEASLGRPATSIETYVADHRSLWAPSHGAGVAP